MRSSGSSSFLTGQKIHLHVFIKAYRNKRIVQFQFLDRGRFEMTGNYVPGTGMKGSFRNLQYHSSVGFRP